TLLHFGQRNGGSAAPCLSTGFDVATFPSAVQRNSPFSPSQTLKFGLPSVLRAARTRDIANFGEFFHVKTNVLLKSPKIANPHDQHAQQLDFPLDVDNSQPLKPTPARCPPHEPKGHSFGCLIHSNS